MIDLKERINRRRLMLADRLLTFCLDRRINNVPLVNIIFFVYQHLVKGVYVSEYIEDAKHHYIPKFLLRKFKVKDTGLIYQYTYFELPKTVSVEKEVAFVKELYTFTEKESKAPSGFLEKQLFAYTLEKYASRIINKILKEDQLDLTFLEESIITSFVSFQYIRTPKFLSHIKSVLEYLSLSQKISIKEMVEDDFYFQVFFENKYKIVPQDLGKFGLYNKFELMGAENLILKIATQIGDHLSGIIYKRNMRMLEVVEPGFFYLSDSPVDIFNLSRARSVGPFLWELKEEVLFFLPITPYRCLYYIPQGYDIKPGIIGNITSIAIPDSIFQFAYSDRNSSSINDKFSVE
jgi:hypothetical protein